MSHARSRSSRSRGAYRSHAARVDSAAGVARPERFRFWVLAVVIVATALGGGSARADALSLLYVRPLALAALVLILAAPGPRDLGAVRAPLILLSLFLATFLIQLVPLPPDLWAALPGHGPLAEAAAAAGVEPVWRPISLAPDLTLNSLFSLVVAFAVLVGMAGLPPALHLRLLALLGACGLASCVLAIGQVTGGEESLQFYRVHSTNLPNGLFANRNHHAVWLACLLPLLAAYARGAGILRRPFDWRLTAAIVVGIIILLLIPATGSRAGLVAGGLMLVAALLIALGGPGDGRGRDGRRGRRARRTLLIVAAAVAVGAVLLGLLVWSGRGLSLQRFEAATLSEEQRVQSLPALLRMAGDFLPFGAGQGAFDPLFRFYEPDDMLSRVYLNHAHNDLIETIILGGVPALLVVLLFLGWLARAGWAALRAEGQAGVMGRAGLAAAAALLLASLADYPVRTPLVTLTLTMCCALVAHARRRPALPA